MKVLFIIDSLGSGGAQNQMSMIASEIISSEIKPAVFIYHQNNFFKHRLDKKGIHVYKYHKKWKFDIGVIKYLLRLLKTEKFEVVVSFLATPNFYAAILKKLSPLKFKLITSQRSKTDFTTKTWASQLKDDFITKASDHIITNSHHEKDSWTAQYPYFKDKISTIYNMVDLSQFAPNDSNSLVENYLVVGSPSNHKNGICLIEAMNILKKRNIKISVNWVGQKVFEIKERKNYIEKMESLIDQYNLRNLWEWTEPIKEIVSLYRSHKALILPSLTEGLPNVVCEAMASGLPVMASNILDHPRLLKKGRLGLLFDPKSPNDLANKIEEFETISAKELSRMKKEARIFAEELFNKNKITNKYSDLFKALPSQQ